MDDVAKVQLSFAQALQIDEYIMFEMPDEVLNEITSAREPGAFQIRGAAGDKAVLVSPDRCFSVRKVESTNLMLLSPPVSAVPAAGVGADGEPPAKKAKSDGAKARPVKGIITCHYELEQINPDVTTLRRLLLANTYSADTEADVGDEVGREASAEVASTKELYTTRDLQRLVQASNAQLFQALDDLSAIEIDGYWRLLCPDYAADVCEMVLTVIEEKSQELDKVDASVVCDELDVEYPRAIIIHVLRQHSKTQPKDENEFFALDEAKICVFRATQLFAEIDPYPHDEFMEQLGDILPYGMTPDAAHLKGHAIIQPVAVTPSNQSGKQFKYLPLSSLSPEAEQRFKQLFNVRERWKMEEIEPYTIDLVKPGQKFDQFLLKHARSVTTKGNVLYTKLL